MRFHNQFQVIDDNDTMRAGRLMSLSLKTEIQIMVDIVPYQ
jgi:hypothetical protein